MIGKTILHYKILEKLGEGGMGVVYKAEDTKLEREVAIKFLPRQIAASEGERERFETEAKAAAALNHANIATIHYVEEVDDETFIVMEYIKGQELKDKIDAGPLPIDDTLNIAIQIAKGLQAAHTKDVIHRDIKSSNIMLTERDDVKIMDFGLAKRGGQTKLTKEGTTLGTVAYMSPEQARGDDVDHRSDIFSVGVLLYEMLTGRLPFKGDYDQAVTYSILNEKPQPVTALRTGIPMELERIVSKCLEKDASDRYATAGDLVVDLRKLKKESETKEILSKTVVKPILLPAQSKRSAYLLPAILGVAALVLIFGYLLFSQDSGDPVIRLINARQLTSAIGVEADPTWSPDGSRLAYSANGDIWVMQLGGGQPVNRTQDNAGLDLFPSWSPDGTQIAFWSDRDGGGLHVMPAVGGKPRSLGVDGLGKPLWSGDGKELAYVILDSGESYIEILSLESRETRRILLPGRSWGKIDLNWSPVRQAFAYVDATGGRTAEVTQLWFIHESNGDAFPISDGLWNDREPTWSPDGSRLYFVSNRGGSMDLWQFNMPEDGKPKGPPEQLTVGIGMQNAIFSPDGSRLAYSRGRRVANLWRTRIPAPGDKPATWGDAEQITFDNALIEYLDVSPDGKTLLFSSDRAGNQDVWKMDMASGEREQLTTNPTPDWNPMLSPGGEQIAFYSYRSGNRDIWVMSMDGGAARQLTNQLGPDLLPTWSPDGEMIAFVSTRDKDTHIWVTRLDGSKPIQLSKGPDHDNLPKWSPDGAKIAFLTKAVIQMMPATGGDPTPIILSEPELDVMAFEWAPEGNKIYFATSEGDLWELSVANGSIRPLTDLEGRYGSAAFFLASDGQYLYFPWAENTGDLWVMDVEKGK